MQSANAIVFVPSSFDFIRVHNYFRKQTGLSFTVLSEWATILLCLSPAVGFDRLYIGTPRTKTFRVHARHFSVGRSHFYWSVNASIFTDGMIWTSPAYGRKLIIIEQIQNKGYPQCYLLRSSRPSPIFFRIPFIPFPWWWCWCKWCELSCALLQVRQFPTGEDIRQCRGETLVAREYVGCHGDVRPVR